MPVTVIDGGQSGLTVDDVLLAVADEWGGNVASARLRNATVRRINRAVRSIHLHNPQNRVFTVIGAPVVLVAGESQYDVTQAVGNGGFGWDNCVEVLDLTFPTIDSRPLEKLDREQYRERSWGPEASDIPQSWFPIDGRRVFIVPAPDQAYEGIGDYRTDVPEVTEGYLGWPHSWDEAMLSGVLYYFAMVRAREAPGTVGMYKREFEEAKDLIFETNKTSPVRPQRAVSTRTMRSSRYMNRDNSRDDRRWR